jgi:branched-chain amino acid transport system substrate-binding protein
MRYPKSARTVRAAFLRRLVASAAAILSVLATLAICDGAAAAKAHNASAKPFTALYLGDLTGPAKVYGQQEFNGFKAAAAYLNKTQGGILGHKIVVKSVSDDAVPSTAVSDLLEYLGSNSAPNLVWSGTTGNEVAALLPVLARHHIYSQDETDNGLLASGALYPDEFATVPNTKTPMEALVAYLKKKGVTQVGVDVIQESFTESEWAVAKPLFAAAGLQVTEVDAPVDTTDETPELSQLKSAGVTAVVAFASTPDNGYIIKARATLGWSVPLIGDLAFSSVDLTTLVPDSDLSDVDFLTYGVSVQGHSAPGWKLARTWIDKNGGLGSGLTANLSAGGWDSLILTSLAAKHAKSITTSGIVKALEDGRAYKSPALATFGSVTYKAGSHEATVPVSDYPIVPSGPIVNGQFAPLP